MRKDIIESVTEPKKDDLWLSPEGLKKFGKNGWELLDKNITSSTPIINEVQGNELVPIQQNGENKAVSVDALIKGGKEVYRLIIEKFKTPEDFIKLKTAIEAGNIIVVDNVVTSVANVSVNSIYLLATAIVVDPANTSIITAALGITFKSNGTITRNDLSTTLVLNGDGTKFLSDNGTYKEIDNVETFEWNGDDTAESGTYSRLKAAYDAGKLLVVKNLYYNNSIARYEEIDSIGCIVWSANTITLGKEGIGTSLVLTEEDKIVTISEGINVCDLKTDISNLKDSVNSKQDTITDLETIRANAAKGATALQEVPEATDTTLGGVKQVTVSKLAEDADVTTVVTAYNELIDKLVSSGIAVLS